ncbi:hypothetical protein RclHR1_01180005 [Rhizophagus clarus]|uniref:AAA+ ATPase domain-containing protein n=1 Tax=Rhizophagus clarus TaxID=94130 RepID=A0A2Z6QWZ7_9GLOM|nr:hypothetical protein RclHR1_01180005 [Rhizophagus clarus]
MLLVETVIKSIFLIKFWRRDLDPILNVICGEHGTGKTTLIRRAANEVGTGVIYIDIPSYINELDEAFGKAINYAFGEHVPLTIQLLEKTAINDNHHRVSKWEMALRTINQASTKYRKRYNKPLVIVYDNINTLFHNHPEILDILQDNAKRGADNGECITVFVSSEVPRRMELRSAWSRAQIPVMEICDLNEQESMDYLIAKHKINEEEAKKMYNLVGGRLLELQTVADCFRNKQTFEVTKGQVFSMVKKRLYSAKLLKDQQHHEIGKSIIQDLLKSEEIDIVIFRKFFKDEKSFSEVLGENVFAYHQCITRQRKQSRFNQSQWHISFEKIMICSDLNSYLLP